MKQSPNNDRIEALEADNKALRLELEKHKDSPEKLKAWDKYVEIATEIYSKGNKDADLAIEMLSLSEQYNFSPDKRVIGELQQENKELRKREPEFTRWEYKEEDICYCGVATLNEYGVEGWELVSRTYNSGSHNYYTFKRIK